MSKTLTANEAKKLMNTEIDKTLGSTFDLIKEAAELNHGSVEVPRTIKLYTTLQKDRIQSLGFNLSWDNNEQVFIIHW